MAELLMPKLSDTMEEGTILGWMKAEGEEVAKGEPLVEIETDKANMTVEAPESGALHILAEEGETLPVGAPIAAIGAAAPAADEGPGEPAAAEAAAPAEEAEERTNIPVSDDGTGTEIGHEVGAGESYPGAADEEEEPAPEPEPEPVSAAAPSPHEPGAPRDGVRASPLARNLAHRLNVDLSSVRGTGPGGRVVRADVEAAAAAGGDGGGQTASAAAPAAAPAERTPAPAAAPAPGERVPLTRLQRTIARRMSESAQAAPHFALGRDVDVTDALALRAALVEAAPEGARPSLNDLIVRAVVMAVRERPDAVSRFDGDALVRPAGVHVGVAVAVERGLLVPVVRDAADRSLGSIAAETHRLAAAARDGTIEPRELEGSVITVSNLGMFGIDRFQAIINPPETAILAVGRAAPRPVVRDGEVVVRQVMTLTLSVDHRALYGAEGATFLGRVAELLERPHSLVL